MLTHMRRIRDWILSHEWFVLLGVLVIVLGVWAFAELADEVVEGETKTFDDRLIRMLRRPDDPAKPIGSEALHEIGRDLTAVGGIAMLSLTTAAVAGYLVMARRFRAAAFVVVATVGGLFISSALKASFDRPRPDIVPHLSHVMTSSFPSGHSFMSATVYLTLGILLAGLVESTRLKIYFIGVALLITGLVGVSRVYMGVHYPTDVLAGWSGGLVWATLCGLVERWLRRRGALR